MKRKTLDVWLATEINGAQFIHKGKPLKMGIIKDEFWASDKDDNVMYLGKNIFKQTWQDEPRKIEMILRDNNDKN